jgi:hypothetical protein
MTDAAQCNFEGYNRRSSWGAMFVRRAVVLAGSKVKTTPRARSLVQIVKAQATPTTTMTTMMCYTHDREGEDVNNSNGVLS